MRKSLALVVAVMSLALAGWSFAEEAAKKEAAAASATVTGEVVDLSCYLGHGAKGKDHKACALGCITKKGIAPGLLTADNKLYLLVPDHGKEKAYDALRELAGEKAKVTGKVVNQGGVQAVLLTAAEKAS